MKIITNLLILFLGTPLIYLYCIGIRTWPHENIGNFLFMAVIVIMGFALWNLLREIVGKFKKPFTMSFALWNISVEIVGKFKKPFPK